MIEIEPVRFGIAGLGCAGSYHFERLGLREDCRVVASYDDCQSALQKAPKSFSHLTDDWNDFLANDQIEVVLLATPPAMHASQTIAALSAGKHVLVETPICLNLFEADAVADVAARSGRQLFVGHTRRWGEDFRTAQQTMATGELGKLQSVKFINWQFNPFRPIPTSNGDGLPIHAGLLSNHWRSHASTGGGLLWEFGVHYFDQLLQLVGQRVESVYGRLILSSDGPFDDGFLAVINFPDGLTAHIEANRVAAAPMSTGWMLAGTLGSYAANTHYTPNEHGEVVDVPLTPVTPVPDEFYQQIIHSVRTGAPNPVPLEQARQTIALIEAVRRSAKNGAVVSLP